MPLPTPKQQMNRILPPEGTTIATCIGLIQIGTVETEYAGETKWIEKIRLTWELPNETHEFKEGEGKKPLVVSQEYSHSMGTKSNLRPIVEGMTTTLSDEEAYAFDLEQLVGRSCLITLGHRESKVGTKYVVVKSTSPLMKGMEQPVQVNPSKILTYENFDQKEFEKLPQFLQDQMKESKQYQARLTPQQMQDIKNAREMEQANRTQPQSIDASEIPF